MLSLLPVVFAAVLFPPAAGRAGFATPAAPIARPAAAAPIAVLLKAPDRRIRALHPKVLALLAEGARRSPTFAALVRAVERTDVIAYVEAARDLPASLAGRMFIVPSTGSQRFVRIQVRLDARTDEIIATIGHELRHVLEVAADLDVRDVQALADLYKRIGTPASGGRGYDTAAAQDAGRTVRSELQG
jgi:hypothetical protein